MCGIQINTYIYIYIIYVLNAQGMYHVLEQVRGVYRILVGRNEGKRPPEDLGVDIRKTLKRILKT
jgi:hypothetical protein